MLRVGAGAWAAGAVRAHVGGARGSEGVRPALLRAWPGVCDCVCMTHAA